MQNGSKLVLGAAVIFGLIAAPVASARDRAEGWKNWADRAEAIDAALHQTDREPIKAACSGVTGTVIGQGFQFPYWAQGLIQVCTVSKDIWLYSGSRRGEKRWCKDLKSVANQIGKAEPVPEEPRATAVALRISAAMLGAYDEVCKK